MQSVRNAKLPREQARKRSRVQPLEGGTELTLPMMHAPRYTAQSPDRSLKLEK